MVGKVNEGWGVAMGTLMHERGTFGAALQVNYRRNFNRLVEIAHEMNRDKPTRIRIRQKLAQATPKSK